MKLHLYDPTQEANITLCGRTNSIASWGGVPAVPYDRTTRNPDGYYLGKKLGYCRKCAMIAKTKP